MKITSLDTSCKPILFALEISLNQHQISVKQPWLLLKYCNFRNMTLRSCQEGKIFQKIASRHLYEIYPQKMY